MREVGDASALQYETDYPVPDEKDLPPDHVLVKNEFAGINFIDTYHRSGLYPRKTPFVAGQEGGGRIALISSSSRHSSTLDFQVGDRVVYSVFGSYAEYSVVPISKLIHVPDSVDMKVAIACMVQGLTAHYLTTSAPANLLSKGDWCLIYSVGSGTGQWAAQIATKVMGYKVIGTCSRGKESVAVESYCEKLIVLDQPYSDSVDTIYSVVMEQTEGKGVKCIMDGIGKDTADTSLKSLATRGIWISFGNASGVVPPISLLQLVQKSAYVTRPKLNDYVSSTTELRSRCNDMWNWIQSNKINIQIDQTFSLQHAKECHLYLESGKSKGKLLLEIN